MWSGAYLLGNHRRIYDSYIQISVTRLN
jgi:hypothetical protein